MATPVETMPLPLAPEEISVAWLNQALQQGYPQVQVEAIDERIVIGGTATKIRLKLRYAQPPAADSPPPALCIKGGFDEALRNIIADGYQLEADFFAHMAPQLHDVPLPRCWFAASDAARGQGIVILDDLIAAGARFGDPLTPYSVDQVAAALEVQARWQGQTWGASADRFPTLHRGAWVRKPAAFLLGEAHWQRLLPQLEALQLPAALLDRTAVAQALSAMWHDDEREIPCLAHVDAHIGNTYLDAQGAPRFIDWQSASLSPGIDDAAYFMSGALSVADRRRHERELLKHYLEALAAHGAPRATFDSAWLGYRRHLMHGFLWAVTPPEMQSPARVAAMSERHIAAIVDHGSLQLLLA